MEILLDKEVEIEPRCHWHNNKRLYLVLVADDELRVFDTIPSQVKDYEEIDGPEKEDFYGKFYREQVCTGRYEIHWGIKKDFYCDYGIKVPKEIFSDKVQSMLKVNRLIRINSNGEIEEVEDF